MATIFRRDPLTPIYSTKPLLWDNTCWKNRSVGFGGKKTVEYVYVSRELARYTFAAPLAGNHEAAGDAILRSLNARWTLVEFKRAEIDIRSELEKYDHGSADFKSRVALIFGNKAQPHFLVFGSCDENGILDLRARHYWGRWTGSELTRDRDVAVKSIPEYGLEYDGFVQYLSRLLHLKSRAGSGSIRTPQFDTVVGVAHNNVTTVTLSDFVGMSPVLAPGMGMEPLSPNASAPAPDSYSNPAP
ncbi:hypothetical protein [Paraburkholderia sp. GAS334]|uniref:hypothetical protein n=1 Tax=Paraburkholderia sp. GAS334 TaxID=3035131 RepID=UPI003D244DC1